MQELTKLDLPVNDPLSCLLEEIRIKNVVSRIVESSSGNHEAAGKPVIYCVLNGMFRLHIGSNPESAVLQSGDIVLLLHGDAHSLQPHGTGDGSDRNPSLLRLRFEWDGEEAEPFISELPPLLRWRNTDRGIKAWILKLIERAGQGTALNRSPIQILAVRLVHILFVWGIREYLNNSKGGSHLFSSVAHAPIGRALFLLHMKPEKQWSLVSLARNCGMSRSSFAVEFRTSIGMTPMAYLFQRRMHRACELLAAGDKRIKEVCQLSGYRSLSAFSKAFTLWAGVSPGGYRRSAPLSEEAVAN